MALSFVASGDDQMKREGWRLGRDEFIDEPATYRVPQAAEQLKSEGCLDSSIGRALAYLHQSTRQTSNPLPWNSWPCLTIMFAVN